MRHKHAVTSAIISGFAPGKFHVNGIESTDINYGLNGKMCQPELTCEKGVFHIYSDGSDLKGKTILERCKRMNADINITPLFFIIVVAVTNDGVLHKIKICLPNKDGFIVDTEIIYDRPKLIAVTA